MSRINVGSLIRPIGVDKGNGIAEFQGTAFALETPGLFVTASHLLEGVDDPNGIHISVSGPQDLLSCSYVKKHDSADLAVLHFENWPGKETLEADLTEYESSECPYLGEEVFSYGYPSRPIRINDTKIQHLEARLMRGNIQRIFTYEGCSSYELSFPVLLGQSGSPVISKYDETVIGVVKTSVESDIVFPNADSRTVIPYGIGVVIWPIVELIEDLKREMQ